MIQSATEHFNIKEPVTFEDLTESDSLDLPLRENYELHGLYISDAANNELCIKAVNEDGRYSLDTLLHELSHLLQDKMYNDHFLGGQHGYQFQLAKKRIQTWYKKKYGSPVKIR